MTETTDLAESCDECVALSDVFTSCMVSILAGLSTLDGSAKYRAVDVALDAIAEHVEWRVPE